MRRNPPTIDVNLINGASSCNRDRTADNDTSPREATDDIHLFRPSNAALCFSPLSETLRTDGLSIGFDYFRFQGSTISSLSPETLVLERTIGKGQCSVVRLGRTSRSSNSDQPVQQVALKTSPIRDADRKRMMIKELKLLCRLDCDCLVRLVGAFFDMEEGLVTTVLEYMDRGSLADLINLHRNRGLPSPQLASVGYQMLWGLSFLHYEGILHRDVKPANCLVDSRGHVKLSDFGISCQQQQSMDGCDMNTTLVGTMRYMSPERLRAKAYGSPSDIWSFGLVLLECATGVIPFHDATTTIDLMLTIEETTLNDLLPESLEEENDVRELLSSCLHQIPAERVPADILLSCPWFGKEGIENADDAALVMRKYLLDDNDSIN